MSRRRRPVPPLPQLAGVDAVRVPLPDTDESVEAYLLARFPRSAQDLAELFATGGMVDDAGALVHASDPCAGRGVWYHRPTPPEPDVPQDLPVIFEDDHLLVVDKPHGLPTTPRGSYVRNTALSLLRHTRREPNLAPAHRLDRLTAGVLLFTRAPAMRGRMQRQFQDRSTRKTYEAVVHLPTAYNFSDMPSIRESRIEKPTGSLQAIEVDGPVNSVTHMEPLVPQPWTDHDGAWAALRLHPTTGQTHQLRVHLSAAGTPIRWDPLYPEIVSPERQDPSRPLQLLARSLAIRHPATRDEMTFVSGRTLVTLEQNPPPPTPDRR